ncbi:MAG: response regulator [Anaerolineae bacterium]
MTHSKKKILVIDDVEDWRITLAGLLADEGYQATTVADREAALNAIKTEKFDLAIVDIRLDESDETNTAGLKLAGELKSLQKGLYVVMITGYETPETIDRAIKPDEHGQTLADDFVRKTDADELVAIVNDILG